MTFNPQIIAGPVRSKRYRAFILTLQSETGSAQAEVYAHQNLDGGSMADKASDLFTLPLTDAEHKDEHRGRLKFWQGILGLHELSGYRLKEAVNGWCAIRCLKHINEFFSQGGKL